jgi:uncharacterized phiE125 gp8 family phage protein
MSLRIVSESTVEPLTLAEAGYNLRAGDDGNSPPTYFDADTITRLITVARQVCEEETELSLIERTYELAGDRFCAALPIILPRPPVRSVTSIKYIDENGVEQTLSASKYVLDNRDELKPAIVTLAYDETWPSTRYIPNAVRVTYVAGYRADQSPPEVMPEAIKQAMHLVIAHYFRNREAVGERAEELPMGVRYLLTKYRVHMGV